MKKADSHSKVQKGTEFKLLREEAEFQLQDRLSVILTVTVYLEVGIILGNMLGIKLGNLLGFYWARVPSYWSSQSAV